MSKSLRLPQNPTTGRRAWGRWINYGLVFILLLVLCAGPSTATPVQAATPGLNFSAAQLVEPSPSATNSPVVASPTPTNTPTATPTNTITPTNTPVPTLTPTSTPPGGTVGPTPTPGTGAGNYYTPQPASTPDPAFAQVWQRTDNPILTGRASRSWMWGDRPAGFALLWETYEGKQRLVQYHDKSRMEITDPNGDRSKLFFVTNGLLVRELISGQMQIGNKLFVQRPAAQIPVAGDRINPSVPTYATFQNLTSLDQRAANRVGQTVNATLVRNGTVGSSNNMPAMVRLAYYDNTLGHNIPDVFWNFMNSRGTVQGQNGYYETTVIDWVYALGYPLSEAYWTKARVGGVEKDVMVQVYERRVLTYTPSNQAAFQVEMGNVGQHYHRWRYGS
jgi:hypothetical protein